MVKSNNTKGNQYHDEDGKFTSKGNEGSKSEDEISEKEEAMKLFGLRDDELKPQPKEEETKKEHSWRDSVLEHPEYVEDFVAYLMEQKPERYDFMHEENPEYKIGKWNRLKNELKSQFLKINDEFSEQEADYVINKWFEKANEHEKILLPNGEYAPKVMLSEDKFPFHAPSEKISPKKEEKKAPHVFTKIGSDESFNGWSDGAELMESSDGKLKLNFKNTIVDYKPYKRDYSIPYYLDGPAEIYGDLELDVKDDIMEDLLFNYLDEDELNQYESLKNNLNSPEGRQFVEKVVNKYVANALEDYYESNKKSFLEHKSMQQKHGDDYDEYY